mmetsp:Transcript_70786/g.140294  ORF Transcript_70786/g.140294 Transcript_70786/m.140294 type:complete len:271 (-) Transcript_70786:922-1734(-)
MKLAIASLSRMSAMPSMRTASRPALAAFPIATVATGTPRGIWTMERRESLPDSAEDLTGTPMTGRGVRAATIPGRCAAPPAPAMTTCSPRDPACCAYSNSLAGVRCAETIVTSYATPNCSSTSHAARMQGRSESEPMITPTVAPVFAGRSVAEGTDEGPPAAGITSAVAVSEPPSSVASSRARIEAASEAVHAVTLTWPILRFAFAGDLPYQWTAVFGKVSARLTGARVVCSDPSGEPMMLSMAACGTFIATEPKGRSRTARKCCSNWSV